MEAIYQQINAGASCTMQFQIRGCTLRGVSVNFIFFLQNDKIYCQCLNHANYTSRIEKARFFQEQQQPKGKVRQIVCPNCNENNSKNLW